MTSEALSIELLKRVEAAFIDAEIPASVEIREYPQETIFLVHVSQHDFAAAAELGNCLDSELRGRGLVGFVTVRPDLQVEEKAESRDLVGV